MKLLTTTLFLSLASLVVLSQNIRVKESNEKIGGGHHPALTVLIPEASDKLIEKEWKSLVKNYKAKVSTKTRSGLCFMRLAAK